MKESTAVNFGVQFPQPVSRRILSHQYRRHHSFFKPHFGLVSLLESREISEWGAKPKHQWVMCTLWGGQHLYPSPPGHVFSAPLWHRSSSGTRGLSCPGSLARWRKRQLVCSQVGREEGNHSRWQRRRNTQRLVQDDQLSAYNTHNYHIITCIPHTLSSALHRESIFITFGGLEAQGERPHTSKAHRPAFEERTRVAGPTLAPPLAGAKAAQRSLPALPSLSPQHVTVTPTHHSANAEHTSESPVCSSPVLLMSRSKLEQRVYSI